MEDLKTYIQMCRTSLEVQQLHEPQVCDRYICACNACAKNPTIYHIYDYDIDSINRRDLTNVEPHYAALVRRADVCSFHAYLISRNNIDLSYIWLPYLHQLWNMVNKNCDALTKLQGVWIFTNSYKLEPSTLEELLFMYIMKNKLGKKWNGNNWENM